MKKNEVPQDKSNLQNANMTEVVYATDENGNFTTVNSTGWEAKALALDESMQLINERIEKAKQDFRNGKVSPIVYFMEFNKMDVNILSSYVGIWSFFVKRHLKPNNFKKLSQKTLEKYASAFEISVQELINFEGK